MIFRASMVQALAIVVALGGSDLAFGDDVVSVGTVDGVIEGEVVQVSADGVSVRIKREGIVSRTLVVPWFDIRAVDDEWAVPDDFVEMARHAALGRARRERGDLSGCSDLYSGLAPGLVGSESEMAIEVFGGLLEEAVVRGDLYDAAVAMAALESLPALVLKSSFDGFDGRYRLHVGVPLLAGLDQSHRLEAVGDVIKDGNSSGGVLVRAFKSVNRIGGESGDVPALIADMEARKDLDVQFRLGLELYMNMLAAQEHPEMAVRGEARRWLESRSVSKSGTWIDAWCRMALGVSYIRESENSGNGEMLSRGVVELVHVIVRFEGMHPELARMAESLAVDTLLRDGRVDEAAGLMSGLGSLTEHTE